MSLLWSKRRTGFFSPIYSRKGERALLRMKKGEPENISPLVPEIHLDQGFAIG